MALARLYRRMGVQGGGGGLLCGLRIDHVIQAIVGTPTTAGRMSPSRTVATLHQPLMALCEVIYADVLLPMCDEVSPHTLSLYARQPVAPLNDLLPISALLPLHDVCTRHLPALLARLWS